MVRVRWAELKPYTNQKRGLDLPAVPMSELLPQTRSSLPACDIDGLASLVATALALHIQTSRPPGDQPPTMVEDFPRDRQGKFDTSLDVVTWQVVSSVLAGTDRTGRERIPTRPAVREELPHPTRAGYKLVTTAWWEWVTLEYTVHAKSNQRANQLATWFHQFLMRYGPTLQYFRARGVSLFQFVGRGADDETNKYGQLLYTRPLRYQLRLEMLDHFEVKTLDSLTVNLGGTPAETRELEMES